MVIAMHVILSEVEESPVYSNGRGAEAFTSPFARTLRRPCGSLSNDSVGVPVMDPYRG